jgi:glycosidase
MHVAANRISAVRKISVHIGIALLGSFLTLKIVAQEPAQHETRHYSAPFGHAVIDGQLDALWKTVAPSEIDRWVAADSSIEPAASASANFRAMWDRETLYFWIEVVDKNVINRNPAPWEQDSVELFVDQGLQRSRSYDADDGQYRISAAGQISYGESTGNQIRAAVNRTVQGYVVEAAIPWNKATAELLAKTETLEALKIGFDTQLNDDHGAGRREAIKKWNEASNESWRDTSGFGTIALIRGKQPLEFVQPPMGPDKSQLIEPAAKPDTTPVPPDKRVPVWAKDAIFYQIFPERFRNGDRANDPTRESLEFAQIMPKSWQITPWTQEWYGRSPWEEELGDNFFEDGVFHRRYGGDLQGVIDKLDYLADLGINVIYFNPVFYARSLHKYDGNSFHHVDPFFGPDPSGDLALMASETADPASWQWTAADRLFLELIRQAKSRGIRIIIDGVFNHTGRDFFAFDDIRKRQQQSPYLPWYTVRQFDDPSTAENEFKYDGWWGVDTLPEFANNPEGTDLHPAPKAYIMEATRRWMDPNNDGDPSDGIDGWRLDVANEVPHQFWRDWHQVVRSVNPQAFTTAEIWDEASNYLAECGFSSTMNYFGFAFPVKGFLIDGKMSASEFSRQIQERMQKHPAAVQFALQNLIDSHDTDRLASMIVNADRNHPYVNPSRHDYDVGERVSPRHFESYDVARPTPEQRKRLRLVALFQFTFVGQPMIYYGTEAGMDGGDDPCCRMPMVWDDLKYGPRTKGPRGSLADPQPIAFDAELHDFYRRLIHLRRDQETLRSGAIQFLAANDSSQTLVFTRGAGKNQTLIAINRGSQPAEIRLSGSQFAMSEVQSLLNTGNAGTTTRNGNDLVISLPAVTGQVWRLTDLSGE